MRAAPLVPVGYAPPVAGTVALFGAWSEAAGSEPWATDGTVEGTGLWLDLVPGAGWSSPRQIVDVEDEVWFTALDEAGVESAWRSGGTPESTIPFAPLGGGTPSFRRAEFLAILDAAAGEFFYLRDGFDGNEIWFSPGSGAEPILLRIGLQEGTRPVGVVGGRMVFAAGEYKDPGVGRELWASDGTAAGTRLLRDIWSGPLSSAIEGGVEVRGRLLFKACDAVAGCELWVTDGTTKGTTRLVDIATGVASSFPTGLSEIDGWVYFSQPVNSRSGARCG